MTVPVCQAVVHGGWEAVASLLLGTHVTVQYSAGLRAW
jgi:acetylglutamate kinase